MVWYCGLSLFHPGDVEYACHNRNCPKQTRLFKLCTIQPRQWSTCADYHYFTINRKYAQKSVSLTFSGLETENHFWVLYGYICRWGAACLTVLADVIERITAQLIADVLRHEASPCCFSFWLSLCSTCSEASFYVDKMTWWRLANHLTGDLTA